jgi:SAM-dependent methyltransferase
VIEHISAGQKPFLEMRRVLKDGGILILGTPDYGRLSWRVIEGLYHRLIPGGYADEHITRYTRQGLACFMEELGFVLSDVEYVLGSEMIMLLRKAEAP